MPESVTENSYALEGFLPLWSILLLGAGLVGFAWWMARRDARVADRPRLTWVFLGLRCSAILVLLYMLAGPTLITSVRHFQTKTVAILVDTSASMGLPDASDGSGNVSRWAAVQPDQARGRPLRQLDQGVARLSASLNQLQRILRLADNTPATEEARLNLARSVEGIQTGLAAVRAAAADLPPEAANEARGLTDSLNTLEGTLGILRKKSNEFTRGKTLAALERDTWLPEELTRLSNAINQMEQRADEFAKSLDLETGGPLGASANPNQSRLEKVESLLASAETTWLKDIRAKATVTRYEFSDRVVPMGTSLWEQSVGDTPPLLSPATHIGDALQQIAIDNTSTPVEAAVLFTDGGQNAGRDPRTLASSLAATRLHIVPIGNTRMPRDVILHHTHAPKAVMHNDTVVVDAIVTAYDCENETLSLELLANETVVNQQTLNITSGVFDRRVQLRWNAADLGRHTLAARVVPIDDERSLENNIAETDVIVMDDTIRVLVADNFPRWETRYLINLFKRDERITFDQLLFEPQPSSGPPTRSPLPSSIEEWSKYRAVILGDLLPSQLTAGIQEELSKYVSDGGGNLIVVAGKQAMPGAFLNGPLGDILPVESGTRALPVNSPFYLHLADEGSMTLATQITDDPLTTASAWREMSHRQPIYSLSQYSRPKPSTHSLLWASMSRNQFDPRDDWTRSFLSWHYVGAGRVVFLAAPVTYKLRYRQGDTFHHRFWGQLLRWTIARDLAQGSHNARLSTDKSRYETGEPVQVTLQLRQLDGTPVTGAEPRITATQEGRAVQEVTLREDPGRAGAYFTSLESLPLGPVSLKATGPQIERLLREEDHQRPVETTVHIDPSDLAELRHPLCNLPLLREIADTSGGLIVPPTGLESALRQLHLEPKVLETLTKKPLWNRWDLFWIFVSCLGLEWVGRKFVGLQ